jgi:hypothetical protein
MMVFWIMKPFYFLPIDGKYLNLVNFLLQML